MKKKQTEESWIQWLKQYSLPSPQGIGDDASLCQIGRKTLVVSKDLLVENTHFRLTTTSPFDLGQKAISVNLSDLAAMGAKPYGFFLGLGLPPQLFRSQWPEQFMQGMFQVIHSLPWPFPLLGGDTVKAERVTLSLTVMGTQKPSLIKTRKGLKKGDILAVTSPLGASQWGLKLLTANPRKKKWVHPWEQAAVDHHLRPRAQWAEGLWLAKFSAVHAMMDLSDGLYRDCSRLADLNQLQLSLDLDLLPLAPGIKDPLLALASGEEYALLIAVDPLAIGELQTKFQRQFARPLFPVGKVVGKGKGRMKVQLLQRGRHVSWKGAGFDHF